MASRSHSGRTRNGIEDGSIVSEDSKRIFAQVHGARNEPVSKSASDEFMEGMNFVQLRLLKGRSSQLNIYHLIVYECGQELSIENRAFNKKRGNIHALPHP